MKYEYGTYKNKRLKLIGNRHYVYDSTGLSKEQYKRLKARNPTKTYRKVGKDIFRYIPDNLIVWKTDNLIVWKTA